MKIALQMGLLPGNSVADKAKWARDNGVEGLELFVEQPDKLRETAAQINGVLPITSVCCNCSATSNWSFDFLDPDPVKRRESLDGSLATLAFCGEVGAVGQIVPPIFGAPRVPDLSPFKTAQQLQEELGIAMCQELGAYAAAHKTLFILEPLNRYEQNYLRKQSDGVRLIKAAKAKGIGLLSDLFHMNIEETDTPAALRAAGKYISHVHLADNTRDEPGTGDIDFVAAFKALHEIGFNGYMAFECGVSGNSQREKTKNLAASLGYVRDCIAQACQA